jgi:hypothetical protein
MHKVGRLAAPRMRRFNGKSVTPLTLPRSLRYRLCKAASQDLANASMKEASVPGRNREQPVSIARPIQD